MTTKKQISELPKNTVQLITASQIITSISHIVKELVENSLDAGSTVIRVKLDNFGFGKLEVVDNGCGVTKEDVLKMALPHYTSKISQHEDLDFLTTYGFRGEALAAICAVGKVVVTTRTNLDSVAVAYTMDKDGNVIDQKPSPNSQGTVITCTSLFWNVPVRKQFSQTKQKKAEELMKVEHLLLKYGLVHPELHISLNHDGSVIWQKNRATDLKANILQTLGHAITSNMKFVIEKEMVDLFMMVPKKNAPVDVCFRQRPDRCFIFINQRPVVSKDIEKLMKQLYSYIQAENSNKTTMYPVYIISLQFAGNEIDVNLEPDKSQVLMTRQAEILELIKTKVLAVTGEPQTTTCKNADEERIPQSQLPDSQIGEPNASGFSLIEQSQVETIIVDDDFFNGFDEPFNLDEENNKASSKPPNKTSNQSASPIIMGSAEWSKGWATDTNGRIVHPVEVLRGQPHFAKRISDLSPLASQAKRAKVVDIEDASRIVGPSPCQLEMVNGKVRKLPPDPYGEYCKEMRNELLSQDPSMSFTDLTQHLSRGWKNLDKSSRENYESKAECNRQRYNASKNRSLRRSPNSNTSINRYLSNSNSFPLVRAKEAITPVSSPPFEKPTINVGFSLKLLESVIDQVPITQQAECWTCIKKLGANSWLCTNHFEIMAVNFTRLYEMILFSRLSSEQILPSRFLPIPISINPRVLGDPGIWEVLTSLSTEWETTSTQIITDPRIQANGLGIRMCTDTAGTSAQVFKIPAHFKTFGIDDVIQLLRQVATEDSTVDSCRPESLSHYFESEASRLASERYTEPDEKEVCELLQQWLSEDLENRCLHGHPVVWHYVVDDDQDIEENS